MVELPGAEKGSSNIHGLVLRGRDTSEPTILEESINIVHGRSGRRTTGIRTPCSDEANEERHVFLKSVNSTFKTKAALRH